MVCSVVKAMTGAFVTDTRTHIMRFNIAKTLKDASGAISVGWVVTTPV